MSIVVMKLRDPHSDMFNVLGTRGDVFVIQGNVNEAELRLLIKEAQEALRLQTDDLVTETFKNIQWAYEADTGGTRFPVPWEEIIYMACRMDVMSTGRAMTSPEATAMFAEDGSHELQEVVDMWFYIAHVLDQMP